MEFVFASSNTGKIREIKDLLRNRFQIKSQGEWGIAPPEETASTFLENALIKARNASASTGLPAMADDSGLCVDALNGLPGVNSANYAGPGNLTKKCLSHSEKCKKKNRKAFFICTLMLKISDRSSSNSGRGKMVWDIAREPKGDHAFGYDPIFFTELGCTAAELDRREE